MNLDNLYYCIKKKSLYFDNDCFYRIVNNIGYICYRGLIICNIDYSKKVFIFKNVNDINNSSKKIIPNIIKAISNNFISLHHKKGFNGILIRCNGDELQPLKENFEISINI